jgi:methanogenic corrinoid protein MtbC1
MSKAKTGPKFLNSDAAARILGVNHRKFLMSHLADFAANNEKGGGHINLLPLDTPEEREAAYHIQQGDFQIMVPQVERLALQGEYGHIQEMLSELYLARHPLYEIYDKMVTPVLHHIGELWANGQINITEEHVASQGIKESMIRLQDIVQSSEEMNEKVLCMNLSEEIHDIAIKMVQHILEERGFQVLFTGQRTPAERMEEVLSTYQPRRIYISSTYIENQTAMQAELDHTLQICWNLRTRVFVGGAGFEQLEFSEPFVERRFMTFKEVAES